MLESEEAGCAAVAGATGAGMIAVDLFCATYKTRPAEYRAWSCMRTRCTNPKFVDWHLYGGRGIHVCNRWNSFAAFFRDMGPKPSPRHSLDRHPDKDGDYEPTNCRWATPEEQASNTRRNKLITFNGESLTECQWARRLGIARESLRDRFNSDWSVERALTTPGIRARTRDEKGRYVDA